VLPGAEPLTKVVHQGQGGIDLSALHRQPHFLTGGEFEMGIGVRARITSQIEAPIEDQRWHFMSHDLQVVVAAADASRRNYVRRRFNRDKPHETPAKLLGLVSRQLHPMKVVRWRQDWGRRSLHPISLHGGETVLAEGMAM
jgi:hypothetical protein